MFESDLFDKNKTTEELLEKVRVSAMQSFNNNSLSMSITPFAALLVKLNREASETADKNITIQKRMIWLTVLVLLISVTQLGLVLSHQFIIKPQSVISTPETQRSGDTQNNKSDNVNPLEKNHTLSPNNNKE